LPQNLHDLDGFDDSFDDFIASPPVFIYFNQSFYILTPLNTVFSKVLVILCISISTSSLLQPNRPHAIVLSLASNNSQTS